MPYINRNINGNINGYINRNINGYINGNAFINSTMKVLQPFSVIMISAWYMFSFQFSEQVPCPGTYQEQGAKSQTEGSQTRLVWTFSYSWQIAFGYFENIFLNQFFKMSPHHCLCVGKQREDIVNYDIFLSQFDIFLKEFNMPVNQKIDALRKTRTTVHF